MPYAAIAYAPGQPLKIEEVEYRDLRDREVLVKLHACGVCHSDLSALNMILPTPMPVILGHEAAGVVEAVGPGVKSVAKGDHVIGVWKPSCGECRYCKEGLGHLCDIGTNPTMNAPDRAKAGGKNIWEFLAVGGFSEMTILDETSLVKIDKSMPLDKAALLGCAVMTGVGAAENAGDVQEGDDVAIFGSGGVGLNIIQGAKMRGARSIIAIDMDEHKFDFAKQFGATHTFKADDPDLVKNVKAVTRSGAGVDVAFDAVGNVSVVQEAAKVAARGGKVIMVGVPKMSDKLDLHPFHSIFTELTYRGSVAGSAPSNEILPHLVELYQAKQLMLDELVTRTYKLSEVNEAFKDMEAGKNARGVLIF